MKGDFSKNTFNRKNHYRQVLMQQGRVLLDSEWNEQEDINSYLNETETKDILGQAGAPMHDAGFAILPVTSSPPFSPPGSPPIPRDIIISKGHFYVDGILCENEEAVSYFQQPDYDATPLPTKLATYVFYLDVWQRHLTALEVDSIREVALGGPDTTTRSKTIWQVKYKEVIPPVNCLTDLPADVIVKSTGALMARSEKPTDSNNPCGLISSGGYKRLENQLYRVEIHKEGTRGQATFKWQRDNGSVLVKCNGQDTNDPNTLLVNSTGRDDLLGFQPGNWVELINDTTDLLNTRGILAELANVADDSLIIKQNSIIYPAGLTKLSDLLNKSKNPRIRRWDSAGEMQLNSNNTTWVKLEDGVEVKFDVGSYHTGEFWMIAARTATSDVEWPFTVAQPPKGIIHHYAKLALLKLDGSGWTLISDCRPIFPGLTELTELFYLSGDGQEGKPSTPLAGRLRVGVSNGKWPVNGASVRFDILSGNGALNPASGTVVTTAADGIASCEWTLGDRNSARNQQVKATLLDASNTPIHLPVIFNAKIVQPALFYVSGDGQEARPGNPLLFPLKVGVSYDQFPVAGAKVQFVVSGGGTLTPVSGGLTNASGIAECAWQLGTSGPQSVTASLDSALQPTHIPITFTADLSVASNVAFDGTGCNWGAEPHSTVEEAITSLCKRQSTGKQSCSISVGQGGDFATLAEAAAALKGKTNDICICLLPPHENEHVAQNLQLEFKNSIKITGCGATIRILGEVFALTSDKITLNGITLNAQDQQIQTQLRFNGNLITASNCIFIQQVQTKKEQPFLRLASLDGKSAGLLNWYSNQVLARTLVAVTNNMVGSIENNNFFGPLVLHFDGNASWKDPTDPRNLQENVKAESLGYEGSLFIRGNTLDNIISNAPGILQTKTAYKNLIVSDNVFKKIDPDFPPASINSLVGQFVNVSNNQFNDTAGRLRLQVVGKFCIAIGNNAPSDKNAIEIFTVTPPVGPVPPTRLNIIPVLNV